MEGRRSVLPPNSSHSHTIILLHGRGSNSAEFAPEFHESQTSDGAYLRDIFPGAKWVFPTALDLPCGWTGERISQWFDMQTTEQPHEDEDEQLGDLMDAVDFIGRVVRDESAIIGPEKVVLGGISQGCASAVHALLNNAVRLAGFVGFSSWLPFKHSLNGLYSFPNPAVETPVLLQHCKDDDVIAISNGEGLRDTLSAVGMSVEWREYHTGGHWMNEPEGIDHMVTFLRRKLQ